MTDAYAAGLLDGEGCLTLTKRSNGKGYAARMDMGMSAKALAVLTAMQERFGGTLRQFRPATERWEAAWTWSLFGGDCIAFLERVLPHLVLKREQALVLLSWNRELSGLPTRADGRRVMDERAYRISEQAHQRIKALNAKGPAEPKQPLGEPWIARLVGGRWVTPQHDLFSESQLTPFSGPWPKSGTMRSGALYARPTWAPRTDASASSSSHGWPTPVVNIGRNRTAGRSNPDSAHHDGETIHDAVLTWATPSAQPAGGTPEAFVERKRRAIARGVQMGDALTDLGMQAQTWSTPTADDANNVTRASGQMQSLARDTTQWATPRANDPEKRGDFDPTDPRTGLPGQVVTWNTPRAEDGEREQGSTFDGLSGDVTAWATPKARDYKDGDSTGAVERQSPDLGKEVVTSHRGPTPPPSEAQTAPSDSSPPKRRAGLNPRFALWLMGLPVNWLDVDKEKR